MPGKDGTGPLGLGAGTGRGLGFCRTVIDSATEPMSEFLGRGVGRRFGFGTGRGFRRRQSLMARQRRLQHQSSLGMADRFDRLETGKTGVLHRLSDILSTLQRDVRTLHDQLDKMQERTVSERSSTEPPIDRNEKPPTETK